MSVEPRSHITRIEQYNLPMSLQDLKRYQALSQGYVVPEAVRCVQCGLCSYNCPIGIDVRRHARRGLPINDSYCLTCGECVARCPRSVLRFETLALFDTHCS